MSAALIARLVTDVAVHELVREDGVYRMHVYLREVDADRELTVEEAGEWIDTVRRCGGLVCRSREGVRR